MCLSLASFSSWGAVTVPPMAQQAPLRINPQGKGLSAREERREGKGGGGNEKDSEKNRLVQSPNPSPPPPFFGPLFSSTHGFLSLLSFLFVDVIDQSIIQYYANDQFWQYTVVI